MIYPVADNWRTDLIRWGMDTWANILSQVQGLLTTSLSEFSPSIWSVISSVNEVLVGVAIGLLAIFSAMQAVHAVSSLVELKRPEVAAKLFVRFIITKTIVTHGLTMIMELFEASQTLISGVFTLGGDLTAFTGMTEEIAEILNRDVGFWNGILMWVICLIAGLLMIVCSFQVLLTVFGRFFKIYMHVALSPLPLATFAAQPMQDVGKSFIKSFVSVCLEGACIALACIIYNAIAFPDASTIIGSIPSGTEITESIMKDLLMRYVLTMVFQMLVLVGAVKLVETTTRNMFGLH